MLDDSGGDNEKFDDGNCKANALAKTGSTLDTTKYIVNMGITLVNCKRRISRELHAIADIR